MESQHTIEKCEPVPESQDEPFWVERVPRWVRSSGWVEATAVDIEVAARSWPSAFVVPRAASAAKLAHAPELVVLRDGQGVIGFVATTFASLLPRTGLTFRYIEGTIVHRERGGPRKFERMMSGLGVRADVEVLHTQSPAMARALAARSAGGLFPTAQGGLQMRHDLRHDLDRLFAAIGRPTNYCPRTGITPGLYDRCLYATWPIPNVPFEGSFGALLDQPTSGVVVVGFDSATAAVRGLESDTVGGGLP